MLDGDTYVRLEDGRWHVRIPINGKRRRFGSFKRKADAIERRDEILQSIENGSVERQWQLAEAIQSMPKPEKHPFAHMAEDFRKATDQAKTAAQEMGKNIQFHLSSGVSSPDIDFQEDNGFHIGLDFKSISIPRNGGPRPQTALTIPSVNLLVLGDLHVPYHNTLMLRRAIYMTKKHFSHIKDIVVIGDWWDFAMLSRHPKDEYQASLNEEIEVSGQVGRSLLKHFDRAWITNGNHCARLAKKLDTPLHLSHLYGMAFGRDWPDCEMHITDMDYLYADSPDADPYKAWVLGHPSGYSGIGAKTPTDIALLEHRNVATGHNHVVGMAQSKCGRYVGVDVGHSTEPHRHSYVNRGLTKYTRWNAGFLIIDNGYPYHFTERFTDWSRYGCK